MHLNFHEIIQNIFISIFNFVSYMQRKKNHGFLKINPDFRFGARLFARHTQNMAGGVLIKVVLSIRAILSLNLKVEKYIIFICRLQKGAFSSIMEHLY